ncbi:MAG: hypothetical protein ACYC35_28860, partial [Pirellulales bacterium]
CDQLRIFGRKVLSTRPGEFLAEFTPGFFCAAVSWFVARPPSPAEAAGVAPPAIGPPALTV